MWRSGLRESKQILTQYGYTENELNLNENVTMLRPFGVTLIDDDNDDENENIIEKNGIISF